MPCNCCEITDNTFGEDDAKANLKDYRKRGPAKQTKLILEAIRSLKLKDIALLDIGGGIGTIHHELLADSTAQSATHVDASSAYLKAAEAESAKRGNSERVQFIHADFTDVASEISQADVVTLDRVVCCYPNFRELLKSASSHAKRAVVMTYPREWLWLKFGLMISNFIQWIIRNPFRVFAHPIAEFDALMNEQGFKRTSTRRLLIWEMALFERNS